jgi:hypothetical protein
MLLAFSVQSQTFEPIVPIDAVISIDEPQVDAEPQSTMGIIALLGGSAMENYPELAQMASDDFEGIEEFVPYNAEEDIIALDDFFDESSEEESIEYIESIESVQEVMPILAPISARK